MIYLVKMRFVCYKTRIGNRVQFYHQLLFPASFHHLWLRKLTHCHSQDFLFWLRSVMQSRRKCVPKSRLCRGKDWHFVSWTSRGLSSWSITLRRNIQVNINLLYMVSHVFCLYLKYPKIRWFIHSFPGKLSSKLVCKSHIVGYLSHSIIFQPTQTQSSWLVTPCCTTIKSLFC